jgi:hypothetical protein
MLLSDSRHLPLDNRILIDDTASGDPQVLLSPGFQFALGGIEEKLKLAFARVILYSVERG